MYGQRPPTQDLFARFRPILNGFIAGLIVGLLLGWFFHGVVSLVLSLGFALLLLIPLALAIWFFFLRRRGGPPSSGGDRNGVQVFTWSSGQGRRRYTSGARRPEQPERASRADEEEIIDLEFEELKRQADDEERRS